MNAREIAEAFSSHHFDDAIPHLAPTVRWVLPGQGSIEGRDSVVDACRASAAQMDTLAAHGLVRLVCVASDSVVAIDAVGRYVDQNGGETFVSSADIYEFDAQGRVAVITSYTVEVGGEDPASPPPGDGTPDRER